MTRIVRPVDEETMRLVRRFARSCEARLVEADVQRFAGNHRLEANWRRLAVRASVNAFEAVCSR